jgi:hypothetical protein
MAGDAVRWNLLRRLCGRSHDVRFIFFRRPPRLVTTDAIVHRELLERSRGRPGESFHRTMAGLTLYLRRRHMNLMGEKNVGGETPHSSPWNLLPLLTVGADFFNFLAFRIAAHVAAQTQRRGRAARDDILLRPLMTRSAGKTERPRVSLVRECNRLFDAGLPTRPVTPGQSSPRHYKY